MSWLDKIEKDLVIVCGDGKEYRPSWINAVKSTEYNITEFDFQGISGTYVHRKLPRGRKFNLDLYYQGESHIENADAFEISASNPGVWTISHPFYGTIYVQPVSLLVDNSDLNLSRIIVPVIETIILENQILSEVSIKEEIKSQSLKSIENSAVDFAIKEPVISTVETSKIKSSSLQKYKSLAKKIKNASDANNYLNSLSRINTIVSESTSTSVDIIQSVHKMSTLPYYFVDEVANRIRMLGLQYDIIKSRISSLGTRTSKRTFESDATSIIFSMAMTAVEYVNDELSTINMIIEITDLLDEYYSDFIQILDGLISENGGSPDSYIPSYQTLNQLSMVIGEAIIYLIRLAKNSKTERSMILNEDISIYDLTYKLYGFDKDGENLRKLIANNNIGLNELIGLKKGRKIIYYI